MSHSQGPGAGLRNHAVRYVKMGALGRNIMSNQVIFCQMIRNRSIQNRDAINQISRSISPAISILRQELDSMVRVIYLLNQTKIERKRLIELTLKGKKWTVLTKNGKYETLTDRKMVSFANTLQGWAEYVYKFGCSFIHLSDFHNYNSTNPFDSISQQDKNNIIRYMTQYHGGSIGKDITIDKFAGYIPAIFNKISSNLECYLNELENKK